MGHILLKQGPHSTGTDNATALLLSGGVKCGEVDPYKTISGVSTAADICINPESLVTTIVATDSKSIASSSRVKPERL